MKSIKKAIAVLLALAMLLAMVSVGASAAEVETLIDELAYPGPHTPDVSSSLVSSAGGTVVTAGSMQELPTALQTEDHTWASAAATKDGQSIIKSPLFGTTDTTVIGTKLGGATKYAIEFDYCLYGVTTTSEAYTIAPCYLGTSEANRLGSNFAVKGDGTVTTFGGSEGNVVREPSQSAAVGSWHTIRVECDTEARTVKATVDGKALLNITMPDSADGNKWKYITGFRVTYSGRATEKCYIDNVELIKIEQAGGTPSEPGEPDVPDAPDVSEETDLLITGEKINESVDELAYPGPHTPDVSSSLVPSDGGAVVTAGAMQELPAALQTEDHTWASAAVYHDGHSIMQSPLYNKDVAAINTVLGGATKYAIEFDYCLYNATAESEAYTITPTFFGDWNNRLGSNFTVKGNGTVTTYGGSEGDVVREPSQSAAVGSWHTIRVECDTEARTVKATVDGKALLDITMPDSTDGNKWKYIAGFRITGTMAAAYKCYIDNFRLSKVTESKVTDLKFVDASGNDLAQLVPGAVDIKAIVKNETGDARAFVMILAAYDGSGKLTDVKIERKVAAAGTTAAYKLSTDLIYSSGTIRGFVWDSITNLKPLIPNISK